MLDVDNNMVNVDVRPSRYLVGRTYRSALQRETADAIGETFPSQVVLEDFTIPGSHLSVDFFLPTLGYVIEVQGAQHAQHNDFFHGDKTKLKFSDQIRRDNKKSQWAEQNGFTFIEITEKDDIDGIRRLRR